MTNKKRLLILGPSFRRKEGIDSLPAFERYDGVFYRVAKKHLKDRAISKLVDIVVMNDKLTLVDGSAPTPNDAPEGTSWGGKKILKNCIANAKEDNSIYLEKKLKKTKYEEIFIAMGKDYAVGLPDLKLYGATVIFPTTGGIGPKAVALIEWLTSVSSLTQIK